MAKNIANQVEEIVEPSMSDIDAILADMESEDSAETIATPEAASELELEAAVSAVERYEGDDANVEASEAPAADKPSEKAKSKKKAKSDKPKAEPKERTPRIYFSKQSDRIAHRLGDKLGETMLLEISDAALTGDELVARNKEVLAMIDGTAKKVGEKAAMLFKWMQTGGKLNEVMDRAFKLLAKDGYITSGDKGTMQMNLLAKPYSIGTARSQSNQIFVLFRALKIANVDGKGKLVPNPESLILAKANSLLGL